MRNIIFIKLFSVVIVLVSMLNAMEQQTVCEQIKRMSKAAAEYKSLIPSDKEIDRLNHLYELFCKVELTRESLKMRRIDWDLRHAAWNLDILRLKEDLNNKADPNVALSAATNRLDPEIVKELLEKGANVNNKADSINPLDWATLGLIAALDNYQEVKKMLEDKGAVKTPEPEQLLPTSKPTAVFRPR